MPEIFWPRAVCSSNSKMLKSDGFLPRTATWKACTAFREHSALCRDALDLLCAILSSCVVVSPQENLRKVAARLLIVPSHPLVHFSRPARSSSSSPGVSPPSKRRKVSEAARMRGTDEWRPPTPRTPTRARSGVIQLHHSRRYTHVLSTPTPNPGLATLLNPLPSCPRQLRAALPRWLQPCELRLPLSLPSRSQPPPATLQRRSCCV